MLGHQAVELCDQLDVPAERKVGVDAVLDRRQPAFLEARHSALQRRPVGDRRPPHRHGR
jgi:hypothetical protein